MIIRTVRARIAAAVVVGAAVMAVPASAGATELLYATTPTNQLISFTAQAPGVIRSSEPIAGLAAGETIIGMDRRPVTGQMYVLTSNKRLLILDVKSGDTKLVSPDPIGITGSSFAFDFNPVGDRIRIQSDTDQNRRVNPENGAVTNDDAIRFPGGDAGAGKDPSVGGVAYTNSGFGGAAPAATELFGIDTVTNTMVKQNPNEGTLATVGALGQDAIEPVQFDISGTNAKYATFAVAGTTQQRLWSLNAAGLATPTSAFPNIGVPAITSLAAAGDVTNDASAPLVSIGNYTTYRGIWTSRGLKFTVVCLTDCTVSSTLRIGSTVVGTATTSTPTGASRVSLIKLTAFGRKLAASKSRLSASITLSSTDFAGNKRTQVAKFSSIPGINTQR